MPAGVTDSLRSQSFLKSTGPHAPATVRRRLANWSTLTKWRGLDGAFVSSTLKSAIRLAVRAVLRTRKRKIAKAVTGDVLAKLLATCATDNLRDVRDRASLMVAFAAGGRQRSEIAGLRFEQLTEETPIEVADGNPLPSLAIHLGRTKTTSGEGDDVVYLTGRPVEALNAWMAAAKIEGQRVSRDRALGNGVQAGSRSAVSQCDSEKAGEDGGVGKGEFSAHGLRSGYLTEAANRGIPLLEANGAVQTPVDAAGFQLL